MAGSIRRTDCSLVTDGAAALVLASEDAPAGHAKAVRIRAVAQANDFLSMSRRDVLAFEGSAIAWRRALKAAGLELDDLDLVETHDCFTIAELLQYQAMGLAPAGRGATVFEEGLAERRGRLPVNLSGGPKAKGHPIGAIGVSMHVVAAMQLSGQAGAMQLPKAALAGLFNMGAWPSQIARPSLRRPAK